MANQPLSLCQLINEEVWMMKVTKTSFSPAIQYQRFSREALSPVEALRIYLTILFGVILFALYYYSMHLTP
jgi:hypothetical protein